MLSELAPALAAVLRDQLPAGSSVRLGPPNTSWATDSARTVGLFPYRVVENRTADPAAVWVEDRGSDGRVVARQAAERRYDVRFLVTGWAADAEAELELLGAVLRAVAESPVVAPAQLTGSLATARGSVTLAVGDPDPSGAADLWAALGLPARMCLDVVVTAPLPALGLTGPAPAPHTIDLAVTGRGATGPGRTPTAAGRESGARTSRRPAARITEGTRDGQTRREAG